MRKQKFITRREKRLEKKITLEDLYENERMEIFNWWQEKVTGKSDKKRHLKIKR